MKKLMITAAVAAMAIGVYAVPTYDFVATVKTTSAKYGKQTTTYTVNLGCDENGVYWWDDLGFANATEAKNYVKNLSNDEKADYAYDKLGFNGVTTKYNNKELYRGSYVWCYTFKFKVVAEDCYRIAGSRKLKGTIVVNDCCGINGWQFDDETFNQSADWLADKNLNILFLSRFGGASEGKANSVECAGEIGDFSAADIGNWSFACQGKWNTSKGLVNNLSGNIVGFIAGPTCASCCAISTPSTFFVCGTDGNIVDIAYDDLTAAYGTFNIKYNAKKSN